jgi:hypothetical protein
MKSILEAKLRQKLREQNPGKNYDDWKPSESELAIMELLMEVETRIEHA